jgi:hypothetical protein
VLETSQIFVLPGHRFILKNGAEIATDEAEEDEHDHDITESLSTRAQRINRATQRAKQNLEGRSGG